MNICTYVTSISMEPKLVMVGLYEGTQTLKNVEATKRGILQLLTIDHLDIIRICGQQSGKERDKVSYIKKRHTLFEQSGLSVLSDAAGFMELSFTLQTTNGSDHVLGIGQVHASKNMSPAEILTTRQLREAKLIR